MTKTVGSIFLTCLLLWLVSPCGNACGEETNSLDVTVTAYTSRREETKEGCPYTTAWGDKLVPGMRAIAVSPDLIPLGLKHGTTVRIKGLKGIYVVLDRMPHYWKRKIDIYYGHDVRGAREWGRKRRTIYWKKEDKKSEDTKTESKRMESPSNQ